MHFSIYYVFHPQNSHQHVSAGIPGHPHGDDPVQEYKHTKAVNRVTIIS
jgi:hypothetical protein